MILLEDGERRTLQTCVGKVQIRRKGDWHPCHLWMPIGATLLALIWRNFDRDQWFRRYATTASCPRAIYIGAERSGISAELLAHELRHFVQMLRELLYSLRYAAARFRLRMEAEAYVTTSDKTRAEIIDELAGGEYGPLDLDVVTVAVDRAFDLYGWERELWSN